ncbi:hypothetical protein Adt_23207 [Abeliophyllum distichum]|uniref:Uncharacterized protein n=1 Tax=Abeliophyllum distichum TaxID=126358 RepID=A0ABD1SA97_9LAMI
MTIWKAGMQIKDLDELRKLKQQQQKKAEISRLKDSLNVFDKAKRKVEALGASLLSEKNELDEKLENAEAYFAANFYHAKAYTNFYNYFTSIDHQEIFAAFWSEHPDFDIASFEAKFSPVDLGDEDKE